MILQAQANGTLISDEDAQAVLAGYRSLASKIESKRSVAEKNLLGTESSMLWSRLPIKYKADTLVYQMTDKNSLQQYLSLSPIKDVIQSSFRGWAVQGMRFQGEARVIFEAGEQTRHRLSYGGQSTHHRAIQNLIILIPKSEMDP